VSNDPLAITITSEKFRIESRGHRESQAKIKTETGSMTEDIGLETMMDEIININGGPDSVMEINIRR
jgi:hypothetical protein